MKTHEHRKIKVKRQSHPRSNVFRYKPAISIALQKVWSSASIFRNDFFRGDPQAKLEKLEPGLYDQ
jgi:hypothetical protein